MFFLSALVCLTLDVRTCEVIVFPDKVYSSSEACQMDVGVYAKSLDETDFAMWKLYCYRVPAEPV